MKYFSYRYETIIRFESPVSQHNFKLRCVPCENDFQKIIYKRLFLEPHEYLTYSTDSFGNDIQYGSKAGRHDLFVFISCGRVSLKPYRIKDDAPSILYKLPSSLTTPGRDMDGFIDNIHLDEGGDLDKAFALCHQVNKWMTYTPGSTNPSTTAAEAFTNGKGVCQDYAHILLALCRSVGIYSRYVNGFISGTGETHAWVEVYDQGEWRGVDPTHDRMIDYGYIKLAHGRDANDCPVNRGVFTGITTQQTEVKVIVEEITNNGEI